MATDYGHRLTDVALSRLEKRVEEIYRQARDELDKTVKAYFADFERRDRDMKAQLEAGEITADYYREWRLAQIGRGERFEALRDVMAERYTQANEVAVSYINDATPGIYALNHNYMAYTIERVAGDIGFTLFDEQTVRRLIVEQPNLMPNYPAQKAIKRGIDLAWGKKQITASVTSGILQGHGVKQVADDLQKRIETMNRESAIRTARTALTGAENAGRLDGLGKAREKGIDVQKEWVATMDGRTRHSHRMVDGEIVDQDKKFSNGLRYPGDPAGPGREVYNCRCTMVGALKDVREAEPAMRRVRNPETGEYELIEDMSYTEWEKWKRGKSSGNNSGGEKPGIPQQISQVDFSKKEEVIRALEQAERELKDSAIEVNCTVTADGKVWKVEGDAISVNPGSIPSSLKGSYSYHNHLAKETYYSFSAADAAFFIDSGEAYSKASDDIFEYVMIRTEETVEKPYEEVYYRFAQILRTDVMEMKFYETIDPDLDEYHEAMKILSKELKFNYERRKKN